MATQDITTPNPPTPARGLSLSWTGIALLLVAIGIGISGYLSYVKLTDVPMVCADTGIINCNVVQNSRYAEFTLPIINVDVAIAYLGLGLYLVIGALIVLEQRIGLLREWGRMIVFALTLLGWIFSMWLVYVQLVLLEAVCQWCLAHEVNITILLVAAIMMLRQQWQSDVALDDDI